MARAVHAFQQFLQPTQRVGRQVLRTLRVQRSYFGQKKQVGAGGLQHIYVLLQAFGIAGKIGRIVELGRIDKNADHHRGRQLAGGRHQADMAVVQGAHGGYKCHRGVVGRRPRKGLPQGL